MPRLGSNLSPGAVSKLPASQFTVDDLAARGAAGVTKVRRDDLDVLTLAAGREWSRPLRGSPHEITFVSFQLQASASTIVDVGGARLGVIISPITGRVQLMFDESSGTARQWKPLNVHVGLARFGGSALGAFPILTVRLDAATDSWDLYAGSRLLADHLPCLSSRGGDRRFVLRAGAEGAWLTGLVMADEHPLYADANANGIDDAFEIRARGGLLASDATSAVRGELLQQWKRAQLGEPPPSLHVVSPKPDSTVATVLPAR
ncbi:hypothetical protein [Horticoccus sp. 23ND18S-11]|uniref:hypothetical protein n=1 Tax=Horticoccus sp. 23ND18S-11 TaxID=3391832 RepID=UPI0039C9F8D2